MPGGSIIALLMWLYRRHGIGSSRLPCLLAAPDSARTDSYRYILRICLCISRFRTRLPCLKIVPELAVGWKPMTLVDQERVLSVPPLERICVQFLDHPKPGPAVRGTGTS